MWLGIVTKIIGSILSSVLGSAVSIARNKAADNLKDGDIADEKWREQIVEDLDDIKKKIDGLARKDLLTSYSFFKEGVVTLNLALDEANGTQNGGSNTTATTTRNKSESGVLNEAIAFTQAIQKLSNTSNGLLTSAEKCFGDARREATRAFCNEALSLPDRIMAAQLRVVSKILECLQHTKAAVAGCMLFLEELHNLPAIRETFSTYFKGGMKSRLYKDSRLENLKSVLFLNFAISEFVARFSGELPNVRNWPRIHLATKGKTIHPLLLDTDVVKEIFDKEEFQIPRNPVITSEIVPYFVGMNSKGQILWPAYLDDRIDILNRSGDIETFCQLRHATANLKGNEQPVMALAIDHYDNVFVIIAVKDFNNEKCLYVLFVFDSSGNEQYERVLDFIDTKYSIKCSCVVNNDGDIIIQDNWGDLLYVCDSNGNLKSRLSISKKWGNLQCVTDQNEIVVHTSSRVRVYTKEGELKRTITVKSDIKSVVFNYVASKIEVLVKNESVLRWPSYSILSYSENDEVECLYLPVKRHSRCRLKAPAWSNINKRHVYLAAITIRQEIEYYYWTSNSVFCAFVLVYIYRIKMFYLG